MPALDRLAHIVLPKLKIQGGGLSNLTKKSDKLVHVFRLLFCIFSINFFSDTLGFGLYSKGGLYTKDNEIILELQQCYQEYTRM